MSKFLFSNFDKVPAKAWKQKIQFDLKGANYNEVLLNKTNAGITVKPFYHKDDFKSVSIPNKKKETKICQTIFIDDVKKVNGIAHEILGKGIDTIRFIANNKFDIQKVFNRLETFKNKEFIVICNFIDNSFLKELLHVTSNLSIKIVLDVLHNFVESGNWFLSEKEDFQAYNNSNIILGINASLYQNAGANIVQQLSYALAHTNEYLNAGLIKKKSEVYVTFSVGSNYFFEIAKVRAFRVLLDKLFKTYELPNITITILLEPTARNKTLYDYNVNMLRTTTECMSAVLAGADVVSNTAYDAIYHKANEFGSRIARNQLLILKEESYFIQKKDIAKGAYYIENVTNEIAQKSLVLFKDIEKQGGFLVQLKKGTIQRKIEESAKKEQLQFDSEKLVLLGTNKYPNEMDVMANNMELYPFVKTKVRKTQIKPIIPRRLAETLEQKRLKEEKK